MNEVQKCLDIVEKIGKTKFVDAGKRIALKVELVNILKNLEGSLEIKTINRIVEILDFTTQNSRDYSEFDAYGDICKIIDEYQQKKIEELKT